MVYRLQVTYDELLDILDVENITGSTIGYTLPPGAYEIGDINLMFKCFFPIEVKVNITIDDITKKSNLINNKTIRFTEKSFFYIILGFMDSRSGPLCVIERYFHKIPGT